MAINSSLVVVEFLSNNGTFSLKGNSPATPQILGEAINVVSVAKGKGIVPIVELSKEEIRRLQDSCKKIAIRNRMFLVSASGHETKKVGLHKKE